MYTSCVKVGFEWPRCSAIARARNIGLADTLAFAPAYGIVNGSLNSPD